MTKQEIIRGVYSDGVRSYKNLEATHSYVARASSGIHKNTSAVGRHRDQHAAAGRHPVVDPLDYQNPDR